MTEVWETLSNKELYNEEDYTLNKTRSALSKIIHKVMIHIKDNLRYQTILKYIRIPLSDNTEIIFGLLKKDYVITIDKNSKFRGMTPKEIEEKTRKDPNWFRKNQEDILNAYSNGYANKEYRNPTKDLEQ